MGDQYVEVVNLLTKTERELYFTLREELGALVDVEMKLIQASQKIVLDQYQSQLSHQFVSILYKEVFGIQYIGEIPQSLMFINRYNTLHMRPLSRKKNSQKNNSHKNIEKIYNKRYYEHLNVDENRALYQYKLRNKSYLMDFQNEEISTDMEVIKLLFTIFTSTERNDMSEYILKLAEFLTNKFEEKARRVFEKLTKIEFMEFPNVNIQDRPILSLLLSRLYYDAEVRNRQHRRIFSCTRTSKYDSRTLAFIDGKLIYNNVEHYLSSDLKNLITEGKRPEFERVVQEMEFSEEDTADILGLSTVGGFHVPTHKRWKMHVDKEIKTIELTFQIEASQCFGAQNVDERAYLDLFAMVVKIVQAPVNSERNLKSQKAILLRSESKVQKPSNLNFFDFILSTAFDFSPKLNYENFQFNILDNDIQTTVRLVYEILYSRFKDMDLQMDPLQNFIKEVGNLYEINNNAFHNIYHGFTVLHGAYTISKSKVFSDMFDDEVALTFLVAAYCHDVNHTGVTNFYEEKITSKLANRFGDRSILQNNSIAQSLNLLAQQEYDFLAYFSEKSWKSFRKLFIQSILATDNKFHIQTLTHLQSAMLQKPDSIGTQDISSIIGGLLHTVDFWGTVKDYKVSYQWSKLVNTEFQKQYNEEARLELEQTPYFKDLNNIQVIAKNEQVFIAAIVSPLYRKVNEWTQGHLNLALQRIDENIEIWIKIQKGEAKPQNYL